MKNENEFNLKIELILIINIDNNVELVQKQH